MKQNTNKLVICGRGNDEKTINEIRELDAVLWLLGTDKRQGADKYFELHDIPCSHPDAVRELPEEVYTQGVPINNSICALLIYAWQTGYTDIIVKGCPMISKPEYLEQRPALAYVVGFLNGKGIKVKWTDEPQNINYGRKDK